MWSVVPLTSFLSASMMRVFSCPRLSLMRARLRFSMMGLEDLKYKREKTNEMTVWFGNFFDLCGTFGFIHNLPFCSLTECGVFRVWSPHLQVLRPQRVEMFSQKYRPAFSFFVFKKLNSSPNKPWITGRTTRSINRVQRAESRLLPANSGAVYWWRMWEVTSVSSPNFTPLFNLAPQFYLKSRACTRAARVRVSWVSSTRPMGTRDMGPGAAGSCEMALPLATCWDAGKLFF